MLYHQPLKCLWLVVYHDFAAVLSVHWVSNHATMRLYTLYRLLFVSRMLFLARLQIRMLRLAGRWFSVLEHLELGAFLRRQICDLRLLFAKLNLRLRLLLLLWFRCFGTKSGCCCCCCCCWLIRLCCCCWMLAK